ncbi:MAG: hypothetical protein V1704_02085 [Candidatus Vogelbacteria bacterium]
MENFENPRREFRTKEEEEKMEREQAESLAENNRYWEWEKSDEGKKQIAEDEAEREKWRKIHEEERRQQLAEENTKEREVRLEKERKENERQIFLSLSHVNKLLTEIAIVSDNQAVVVVHYNRDYFDDSNDDPEFRQTFSSTEVKEMLQELKNTLEQGKIIDVPDYIEY